MPETHSALAGIDLVIILAYTLGMLAVGAYYSRYVHSSGDYLLAGKALPFWAIGVSIVASDIGAIDLVFGSGGAYQYGVSQANFDWIGSVPAVFLAAFIFVPYYWRAGVFTIPEFLGRRYNRGVQYIEAVIWLIFMTTNVAIMLYTASVILNTILGWDTLTAICFTAVIVGVYTVAGGLAAIVMTDVMQVVVMFIGTGALVVLGLWEAGGLSGLAEKVSAGGQQHPHYFSLLLPHDTTTPYPWTGILMGLGLVLSTAYFVGNQAVLQRALGARSEWDAKAGMIVAGLLKLAIPLLMFLPGLCARALYPNLQAADQAVPHMVRELMPPGLTGLMFAAFFAAIMSSVDSYLNSCTTVFISDIYRPMYQWLRGHELPDRHGLMLGRGLTAGLLIVGVPIAMAIKDVYQTMYTALQTMLSLFQGPTLALLLLGILWSRATGWGGLAGLVIGVCTTLLLTLLGDAAFPMADPFLFVGFWSFVVSMVVTIVVSLLTPAEPPEKLRGLVMGQVMQDAQVQAALQAKLEQA